MVRQLVIKVIHIFVDSYQVRTVLCSGPHLPHPDRDGLNDDDDRDGDDNGDGMPSLAGKIGFFPHVVSATVDQ